MFVAGMSGCGASDESRCRRELSPGHSLGRCPWRTVEGSPEQHCKKLTTTYAVLCATFRVIFSYAKIQKQGRKEAWDGSKKINERRNGRMKKTNVEDMERKKGEIKEGSKQARNIKGRSRKDERKYRSK